MTDRERIHALTQALEDEKKNVEKLTFQLAIAEQALSDERKRRENAVATLERHKKKFKNIQIN